MNNSLRELNINMSYEHKHVINTDIAHHGNLFYDG